MRAPLEGARASFRFSASKPTNLEYSAKAGEGATSKRRKRLSWRNDTAKVTRFKPTGRIPIKDYEELLERVENAEDIAWLKRARRKPLNYRPLEDYLAERKGK